MIPRKFDTIYRILLFRMDGRCFTDWNKKRKQLKNKDLNPVLARN